MKNTIGIDIGLSGALSLVNKEFIEYFPMPTIDVKVGKKIRKQYDIHIIAEIISNWLSVNKIDAIVFERLRGIPNQASQTAFSMGGGSMLFKTISTLYNTLYQEIEPRTWQKKIFGDLGIQYDKKTTKKASIQAAKRLFPTYNFLATERSRVPSDGITDALLIGYYYNNLNN